jgi:hypothetical protein
LVVEEKPFGISETRNEGNISERVYDKDKFCCTETTQISRERMRLRTAVLCADLSENEC